MLSITEVKITIQENKDKLLGYASIVINNSLAIHDIKIIRGKRIFINFPSKKHNGSFYELVHPINQEIRVQIEEAILSAYFKIISKELK